MKINVELPNGNCAVVDARDGWTVKDAMRNADVDVMALCGGSLSCGTCHVHVNPQWIEKLSPASEDEEMLLEDSETFDPSASRLSCQITCTDNLDGLEVALQEDSWEE